MSQRLTVVLLLVLIAIVAVAAYLHIQANQRLLNCLQDIHTQLVLLNRPLPPQPPCSAPATPPSPPSRHTTSNQPPRNGSTDQTDGQAPNTTLNPIPTPSAQPGPASGSSSTAAQPSTPPAGSIDSSATPSTSPNPSPDQVAPPPSVGPHTPVPPATGQQTSAPALADQPPIPARPTAPSPAPAPLPEQPARPAEPAPAPAPGQDDQPSDPDWLDYQPRLATIIDDLLAGREEKVYQQCNTNMKTIVSLDYLKTKMARYRQEYGRFQKILDHQRLLVGVRPSDHVYQVRILTDQDKTLLFTITIDADNHVAGLFIK